MSQQQDPQQQQPQQNMVKYMIWGMWLLLVGLLTLFFSSVLEKQYNPNQHVASSQQEGAHQVVLTRNKFGHYVASGMINQYPVVFLLDTGATHTSIPASLAHKIGLKQGSPIRVQTANGIATNYTTRLDSVSLGDITLYDLNASINPNVDDEEVLLGMSFLKNLEFTQKGHTLTLSQYPTL